KIGVIYGMTLLKNSNIYALPELVLSSVMRAAMLVVEIMTGPHFARYVRAATTKSVWRWTTSAR
ncbi:MAG TPA: hypothetical protein VF435_04690, partial [Pyrinomonadaceae bacterium]